MDCYLTDEFIYLIHSLNSITKLSDTKHHKTVSIPVLHTCSMKETAIPTSGDFETYSMMLYELQQRWMFQLISTKELISVLSSIYEVVFTPVFCFIRNGITPDLLTNSD